MPSLGDLHRIIGELGDFLETHSGAISAVSAVFVAAFTYTLWRATTRMWRTAQEHARHLERSVEAARMSAEAAIAVETARLFISNADFAASGQPAGRAILHLANRGRTPAIVFQAA